MRWWGSREVAEFAASPSSPCGLRRAPRFALRALRGCATRSPKGEAWWSQAGSNRRPLACHASALPAELWPLWHYRSSMMVSKIGWHFPIMLPARLGRRAGKNPDHRSGPISSLLVAADIADDVGDVLVAFFFVGDEGGIVIVDQDGARVGGPEFLVVP